MTPEETPPTEQAAEAQTPPPVGSAANMDTAMDELLRALAESNDRWMRVSADLANVQKRAVKDREQARRFAVRDAVRALLPCFDNLERAVRSATPESAGPVLTGVQMVCDALPRALAECGVTAVSPEGGAFDPRFHEAIGQMPREDVPAGTVIEVQEKGYLLADLVIRPARVVISTQPVADSGAG